jgi:thermostable 8-oxoguanine DNA glycosylase
MNDASGKKISNATAGAIVQIVGLPFQAELGDKFLVINEEKLVAEIEQELANYLQNKKKNINKSSDEQRKGNINLIVSADTQNRLETLE